METIAFTQVEFPPVTHAVESLYNAARHKEHLERIIYCFELSLKLFDQTHVFFLYLFHFLCVISMETFLFLFVFTSVMMNAGMMKTTATIPQKKMYSKR